MSFNLNTIKEQIKNADGYLNNFSSIFSPKNIPVPTITKPKPKTILKAGFAEGLNPQQTQNAYKTVDIKPVTNTLGYPSAQKNVSDFWGNITTEFSPRNKSVPIRRLFAKEPVQTKAPPIVSQLGSLGFRVIESVPKSIVTAGAEIGSGFRPTKVNLGFDARRLGFSQPKYITASKEVTDKINNGENPWIAALNVVSNKTLDISFGASILTGLSTLSTRLLNSGGSEARVEAQDIVDAFKGKQKETFARLKNAPLDIREKALADISNAKTEAEKVLSKLGKPTNLDKIKLNTSRYTELLGRETPINKDFFGNITKPDISLKTPKIEPAPIRAKQLPGTREVPNQAPSFGLSLKKVEDVGKDSLVSDAKKAIAEGKSMKEFVDSQPKVYHQTNADIKKFSNKPTFFNTSKRPATYGKITIEATYDIKKPFEVDAFTSGDSIKKMIPHLRKQGYDSIIAKENMNNPDMITRIIAFDPENQIKTKSQLQQIYKDAKVSTKVIPEQVNTKQFTPKEVLKAKEDYKKQFNVDSQSVNPKLDKLTELDHQTNILQNLEMSRYKPKDVLKVGLNQMAPSELGSNLPATAFFRYSRTLVDEAANKGDVSLLDMWSKGDTETVKGKAGQSLQATGIASRDSSAVGVEEVKKLKFKKLPDYLQKNHDKSVLDMKDAINNLTDKLNKTPLDKATIYEIINKLKC